MNAPNPHEPPPPPPWATAWHRPIFDSVVTDTSRANTHVPRSMAVMAMVATAALGLMLGLLIGRM